MVGRVAAGASGAVEEEKVGGGREHAAGAGHVAVAADDGDARHADPTKPKQLFCSVKLGGIWTAAPAYGVWQVVEGGCGGRARDTGKIN